MKWLVVGAAGQLGKDLMQVLPDRGHIAVGYDLPKIDITEPASVRQVLEAEKPDVVVNCAAYTAVDAAESDEERALLVNGRGPEVLAQACAADPAGPTLVHISTDYVFGGDGDAPYSEDAAPAPRSAYGRTKLAGEVAVRQALPSRSYVVRTAWLYGAGGPNFVKTMLALEISRPAVAVVDDQRGQPTWSRDLAHKIVDLVEADAPAGIYHGTSSGEATWFDFTREIFRLVGADPARVAPTTTDAFPRPAPRPAYSVLGHGKWAEIGVAPIRDWREALIEAMPTLRG